MPSTKKALQKLLRSPSALSRARASLAYLPDMSRDSLRGFAHPCSRHFCRAFLSKAGREVVIGTEVSVAGATAGRPSKRNRVDREDEWL